MDASNTGRCPDCCYPLVGLTVPRCPECGLEFDQRLLVEPDLAIPRPAWERRPWVSRRYAAWRTLIDVTFHPQRFFSSIQQPNRLRRSILWFATVALLCWAIVFIYGLVITQVAGFGGRVSWLRLCWWVVLGAVRAITTGVLLVGLPMGAMLLVADVFLWRDRTRFRHFFKVVLYSMTVFFWLTVAICLARDLVPISLVDLMDGTYTTAGETESPWSNWLLAVALTWQYGLIGYAVFRCRFATLLPAKPRRSIMLLELIVFAWFAAMYLVLFDCHLGLRFMAAAWGRELF